MTTIFSALTRLVRDDKGSQATEIALGIVLIALVAGLGMVEFGESVANFFTKTGAQIDAATPGTIPTPNNITGTD
jgi:Flp pilus assembly pilin Flp